MCAHTEKASAHNSHRRDDVKVADCHDEKSQIGCVES